tara:strand:+ start:967 stop:1302 length:336 start_codon:yes stop_codon:yes gene_type:complete
MELIAAILGPLFGGAVSLIIWQAKKNSESIHTGLKDVRDCVHAVERKVDTMATDNAEKFATKKEMMDHQNREEGWHNETQDEMKELKTDVKDIKEMQWGLRVDILDIKNKK